jgi:hypothetical protein
MRNNILKAVIYISGIFCLYVLLAIRILPLWNLTMKEKEIPGYWDNNLYGELYYFNNIRYFREYIPPVQRKYQFTEKHPRVGEAEIFVFGDSFVDFSRNTQITERIADSLDIPVFHRYSLNPIGFFSQRAFVNEQPKILLYIRTERWIPISFGGNRVTRFIEDTEAEDEIVEEEVQSTGIVRKAVKKVIDFLFNNRTDALLKRYLQRSYVISEINSFIATLKFDLFGYYSSFTPKYTLDEDIPWLFLHDQLNSSEPTSFYYQHTEEELELVANNIQLMAESLKQNYNLELIFMPVPAKYTIYHHLVEPNAKYNNFLPKLYEKLDQRNIKYVDLLEAYRNADENVYYGTDEHWTEAGATIATHHAIEAINAIRENQSLQSGIDQSFLVAPFK